MIYIVCICTHFYVWAWHQVLCSLALQGDVNPLPPRCKQYTLGLGVNQPVVVLLPWQVPSLLYYFLAAALKHLPFVSQVHDLTLHSIPVTFVRLPSLLCITPSWSLSVLTPPAILASSVTFCNRLHRLTRSGIKILEQNGPCNWYPEVLHSFFNSP